MGEKTFWKKFKRLFSSINTNPSVYDNLWRKDLSMKRVEEVTEMKIHKADLTLALAERNHLWDATAADKRVRAWAKAEEKPNANYGKAFFWVDPANKENFTAYKLQFADVIGGVLKAVPKGFFAAAGALRGARGGVDIPAGDVAAVKRSVERYYYRARRVFNDDTIIAPWNK